MRDAEKGIAINKEQAKVVERIFKDYLEVGSHILTRRLNVEGISTQLGKKWSGDKITRIIKNKIYTGTAVVNRSEKNNVTDTKRYDIPENEWIEIPNATPLIIEFEQWGRS